MVSQKKIIKKFFFLNYINKKQKQTRTVKLSRFNVLNTRFFSTQTTKNISQKFKKKKYFRKNFFFRKKKKKK